MQTQEKTLFKFEIDETEWINTGNEETKKEPSTAIQSVEFEILPPVDLSEKRRAKIYKEIADIDEKINFINARVDELNSEINSLTNHADGLDYAVAVASGVIAGIIDSVWVGEFSLDRANDWGNKKADNFVVKVAQSQGYKGDDLPGSVKHLEKKFEIVADKATNDFGGGKQHHLRDFSHHPTPIGLFFSFLTQFTECAYGTDVTGRFIVVPLHKPNETYKQKNKIDALIGKNLPEKIMFGVVNWFFHMVSDIAGSASTVSKGGFGTGLPGPIVSMLKEISALPIFKNLNEKGYNEFSIWISKLFNGTLLGEKDENGKITEAVKFDMRTELGIVHELGRQAIPVIINECIVRGFYFIRKLFQEIKNNNIKSIADLKEINWKNTLPFKNRTVVRMLTIATGTFTAFDIADAAIRSGGFNSACLLRINFVGVGRFVIAIVTDIGMDIKKNKKENERIKLKGEQIELLNAKLFYKEADMWIEAENTDKAIQEAYIMMDKSAIELVNTWTEIKEGSKNRRKYIDIIKENDKDFTDELANLTEWGI